MLIKITEKQKKELITELESLSKKMHSLSYDGNIRGSAIVYKYQCYMLKTLDILGIKWEQKTLDNYDHQFSILDN